MRRPFLLAQLSDPHLGADWAAADPAAGLERAIDAIRALPDHPDAVVVTGDLCDNAAPEEYAAMRGALARLGAPAFVLAGNHDSRASLRAAFGVPGTAEEPVQYAADLGPLRLIALDSTRPGEARGELDAARLDWLDAELAAAPAQPTVLAMHHPPLRTAIPAWDRIGLPDGDRAALAHVLHRHPQVRRVLAGHVHRMIVSALAGRPVLSIPSTFVQARMDVRSPEINLATGPAGFAVHALVDGELASHVETFV